MASGMARRVYYARRAGHRARWPKQRGTAPHPKSTRPRILTGHHAHARHRRHRLHRKASRFGARRTRAFGAGARAFRIGRPNSGRGRGVVGNALDAESIAAALDGDDTLVHLVGTPHPNPSKAEEFRRVDLASIRASVAAAKACGIGASRLRQRRASGAGDASVRRGPRRRRSGHRGSRTDGDDTAPVVRAWTGPLVARRAASVLRDRRSCCHGPARPRAGSVSCRSRRWSARWFRQSNRRRARDEAHRRSAGYPAGAARLRRATPLRGLPDGAGVD